MKKNTILGIVLVLSLSLVLGACALVQSPVSETAEEAPGEVVVEESTEGSLEENPVTLKIVVLPIIDTIPLFVAESEGLFEAFGLNVEFIPVSSAPELSQMIASGQADGMVTDGLSVAFFDKEEIKIQIVRYGQIPSEERGHFFILAAKDSGITSPADLKGVEIAISEGTIIEYIADRLLEKEGFSADEIATIAVPKIPERMALLASGEIQAAVLPDPLASLAVAQGATIILDDSQSPEYGASVYVFTTEMIEENPEAIRAFVEVIDIAVNLLAENPEEYENVLLENNLIPGVLIDTYIMPPFPNGIYSEAEWLDTLSWAQEKGLLSGDIPYSDAVNTSFLH
ncbi:MAG: ABC transporter substrate-binding protein [Anaerolineae bacterium]|jgi:NitT/TauT family transport system substrate-binding protein|nr:ABC transporter substrate-binding protein [Anaerolineae bacterium]MBT7073713.1 ABC transporter substrate-binding protein [Anaerolineae bacterium]MBT7783179.1 ABC transporter substrate-binding protein [Anaerolineae bacterium]